MAGFVSRSGILLHGCCALRILDKRGCVLVMHVDVDVGSCRAEGCMLRDIPRNVGSDFVRLVVLRWLFMKLKVGRQMI